MSYVYIPIQNIFAKVVKSDKIAIDFSYKHLHVIQPILYFSIPIIIDFNLCHIQKAMSIRELTWQIFVSGLKLRLKSKLCTYPAYDFQF